MALKQNPHFELRSGNVDTLQFVVKTSDLAVLEAELTRRFEATPEFFNGDDVVAIDLRRLDQEARIAPAALAALLDRFKMHPFGVIARPDQREWAVGSLPLVEAGDRRAAPASKAAAAAAEPTPAAASAATAEVVVPAATATGSFSANRLIVDTPLRSGQRIYSKGDLIVLALVSYGAEVIAEGDVHIYAPLRGRAIAGGRDNPQARILCSCLEAELIGIAGVYRTSDPPFPKELVGKGAQIRLSDDRSKLIIEALQLN